MNSLPVAEPANHDLEFWVINHAGYNEIANIGTLKYHSVLSKPLAAVDCGCIEGHRNEKMLIQVNILPRWEA